MSEELWTIEQLPDRVAELLSNNYDGQSNGRVRELPNRRTIRWYTTIGLVDRPVASRGRNALYGPRHLLQLAAVKRLQAAGRTLAEIQEQLVGASNQQLVEIAQVSPMDVSWTREPVRVDAFWRTAAHTSRVRLHTVVTDAAGDLDSDDDSVAHVSPDSSDENRRPVSTVYGIRLADGVTVVLDAASRPLEADEVEAVEAAAAPLLELLDRLGLSPSAGKERR
jgi:DNA-binding transcriptional MerR regulator